MKQHAAHGGFPDGSPKKKTSPSDRATGWEARMTALLISLNDDAPTGQSERVDTTLADAGGRNAQNASSRSWAERPRIVRATAQGCAMSLAPWPFAPPRTMRDARAEGLLLRPRDRHEVDECAEVDDLAQLLGWTDEQVEAAVDALVAAGRIELQATARGVLIWLVDEPEAAAA